MDFSCLTEKKCPLCGNSDIALSRAECNTVDAQLPQMQESAQFTCGIMVVANSNGETIYYGECQMNPNHAEDKLSQKRLTHSIREMIQASECNVVQKSQMLQGIPEIN